MLPTLELPNGTKLTQSPAILEFLEESFPAIHPLLPSSPLDRALVRALMNMIACDIHPVQNLRVLKRIGPEKKAEWARHFITLGFEALEKALEKTSGKYCFKGMRRFKLFMYITQANSLSNRQHYHGGSVSCSAGLQRSPVMFNVHHRFLRSCCIFIRIDLMLT